MIRKKLQITKADGQNSDVDLTEAFKANNISYNKPIANTNRTTVEDAIDALNTEVNRAVKKVNNVAPDDQGNISVAAAQDGTRITMTFGTGGTPVEIATYMTEQEVNQIKALFT